MGLFRLVLSTFYRKGIITSAEFLAIDAEAQPYCTNCTIAEAVAYIHRRRAALHPPLVVDAGGTH